MIISPETLTNIQLGKGVEHVRMCDKVTVRACTPEGRNQPNQLGSTRWRGLLASKSG
jgi:hypothetical protein